MTVKIGINGFGRIGRLAFRRIFELQARGGQAGDIEVAAINDLTTPATLAYLLKYDSTHGTFRHDDGTPVDVKATEDSIIVDGKEYKVYAEKDANNIPWVKNDGVEYVLECTGFYTSAEKSQAHINAGAKKVLISAPAKDETTPTIGKVVPSVNGKLQGHAQRVQVPDGSVTELTTVLNTETTADEINEAFKAAFSDTDYYGYNDEGIVSSDILGDTHGGVFDPTQTDVNTIDGVTLARTVSFYDNEYGFTSNMIRTLLYFAEISE